MRDDDHRRDPRRRAAGGTTPGGRFPGSRPATGSRALATLAALVVLAGAAGPIGCASDGPSLSGFALGSTRIVRVGETLELRTPLRADGSRQWRVSAYDSRFLSVVAAPQPVRRSGGGWELLVRAQARTPGQTEVELTEVVPRGQAPRTARYSVTINP